MSDGDKHILSKEELVVSLQDQISNLIDFCHEYDKGKIRMAKPISTILRNLFHTGKRKGTALSLLSQLSILEQNWFDYSARVPVIQDIDTFCLVNWVVGYDGGVKPNFYFFQNVERYANFTNWWNEPVANSLIHGSYSREKLVLDMADKEGSHVDSSLPKKYKALRDGNFVSNIKIIKSDGIEENFINTHCACIRTIAHETLLTLRANHPSLLLQPYSYPRQHRGLVLTEEKYKRAISLDPNNVELLSEYASFLEVSCRDYYSAAKIYDRALDINPKHCDCLNNYANLLSGNLKNEVLAEQLYLRALDVVPQDPVVLFNYALHLTRYLSDIKLAEKCYRLSIKFDPTNQKYLESYAFFLIQTKKDMGEAEKIYKKIVKINPQNITGLVHYANILSFKNDNKSAESLYKRALEVDPTNVLTLNAYAIYLITKNNDYEKADEFFKLAIHVDPFNEGTKKNYSKFKAEFQNNR